MFNEKLKTKQTKERSAEKFFDYSRFLSKNIHKSATGAGILEIVIALAIFILIVASITSLVLGSYSTLREGGRQTQAQSLAQEGLEAVRSIRDRDWNLLSQYNQSGLKIENSEWAFKGEGTNDVVGNFTRDIAISPVYRDSNYNIVAAGTPGANLDNNSKEVKVKIKWQARPGAENSIERITYLTNWQKKSWAQTTAADFNLDGKNSVQINDIYGGEVSPEQTGNWVVASILATYNISGTADLKDIFIVDNVLYATTNNNAVSGDNEFIALDISDISSGKITKIGSVEIGGNANALFISGNYAYVATSVNTEEVVVIRLSDLTKVNTINLPTNFDALAIYGSGNNLYIGTANSTSPEFYVYNISNPEGTIQLRGSTEIGANVNGIAVEGGYAFLTTPDSVKKLDVVKLSNFKEVNSFGFGGTAPAGPIKINDNKAYVGLSGSADSEFYALNISSPEGTISILNSIDLGTDGVNKIFIDGNKAFLATSNSGAQEAQIIDLNSFTKEASVDLIGVSNSYAIWFYGAYIYVGSADNNNELQVIKSGAGGWRSVLLKGSFKTSANANDAFIIDNYAYVVTDLATGVTNPEFYILDISDISNPIVLGSLNIEDTVNKIFVSGNTAYLATNNDAKELILVDISNKSSPLEVGSYNANGTANGLSVFVLNNKAYLGTSINASGPEFYVLNINGANLSLAGTFEVGDDVNGISTNGTSAYLATSQISQEFLILNVQDPAMIYKEDKYDRSGATNAYGIYVDYNKSLAYLTTQNAATLEDFYIFNVKNTGTPIQDWSAPRLKGSYNTAANIDATAIFISGDYAYLGTRNNAPGTNPEFYILDISNPKSPLFVSSLDLKCDVNDIFVSGNIAYLATSNDAKELMAIDITNKSAPVERGSYNAKDGIDGLSVYVAGNTAYLGTANNVGNVDYEFYALNVTNPASISSLGTYEVTGNVNKIYVNGQYAYLATTENSNEFIILNVSNPANIAKINSYNTTGTADAYGIAYENGNVFLTTDNNGTNSDFYIFDVQNPTNIIPKGSLNLNTNNRRLAVGNGFAFVTTTTASRGLTPINISNLDKPATTTPFNIGAAAYDVALLNNLAFTATGNDNMEMQVVGPGLKTAPFIGEPLGKLDLNSDNFSVAVDGDYAFVATGVASQGLALIDITNSAAPFKYSNFNTGARANNVMKSGNYAYLATDNAARQFQITGASGQALNYAGIGWLTSLTYDSGSPKTKWDTISWTKSGSGEIQFQLRTASTQSGLTQAIWVGDDGTLSSYYVLSSGDKIILDPGASGSRWIQFRARFNSDGLQNPVLEGVILTY